VSDAKFTPWRASGSVVLGDEPDERKPSPIVCRCDDDESGFTSEEQIENARLIAAAPEMLKALEMHLRWYNEENNLEINEETVMAQTRRAILLATVGPDGVCPRCDGSGWLTHSYDDVNDRCGDCGGEGGAK
jgi:hypothetical protein